MLHATGHHVTIQATCSRKGISINCFNAFCFAAHKFSTPASESAARSSGKILNAGAVIYGNNLACIQVHKSERASRTQNNSREQFTVRSRCRIIAYLYVP